MKVPMPPPDPVGILSELAADEIMNVIMNVTEDSDRDYLPWDKLRYKTPPPGMTPEHWWAGVRLSRNSRLRTIPLVDVNGKSFSYGLPDEVLRLADEISRRASGQIAAAEQVTSPATRDRYIVSSLIEEAITSSQLEGASTSRRDAKQMIRSGRKPRDHSELMIFNNYLAMQRIGEVAANPLTPEVVLMLHKIVTDGTLDSPAASGAIQTNPDPTDRVAVWGDGDQLLHRPPPVDQLPARLRALCEFANATSDSDRWMPPVLRALTVHFMAGYDHYFEDGNGRTARALFYWCMLNQGYWLTEYLSISRILKQAPAKYVRSFMLTEQDGGDLTYFFLFHLSVIKRAMDDLDSYLARKTRELRSARILFTTTPGEYNYRQLAILELAIKDPGVVLTALEHARSHQISGETGRQDLQGLADRGLLVRSKIGRKFVWSPAPNLAQLIQR